MTRAAPNAARAGALALVSAALVSCGHPSTRWESVVQIVRKEAVEKDETGAILQMDLEVEWDPCPGDQFQVVRGGRKFAACADKYAVGDYVPVVALHFWDPHGFYRWDIERLGDCAHAVEPESLGSYEKSQDCRDVRHYDDKVGFECSRRPHRKLLSRCPWMARE